MPPSPVPRPGRARALRRGSRYFTAPLPAANQQLRRCAPMDFAHGLHMRPCPEHSASQLPPSRSARVARPPWASDPSRSQPRLRRRRAHRAQLRSGLVPQSVPAGRMGLCQNTPSRARVARLPWNSGRSRPTRSLACAAAAPIATSSDPALCLSHKALRLLKWDCAKHSQPHSRRAAALELRPIQSRSHPRLRRRRARRAQLDLALLQGSAEWDCRHPQPSAARAVRESRSRVARGLRQLASAVRLSKNHRIALTHRPKAHSGHDINLG